MKKDSSPLMKKDNSMNPNLKLLLPPPDEVSFAFITRSGTFTDGDLLVNKDDVQIVSQTDDESDTAKQLAQGVFALSLPMPE
ncbi:MAP kinase kinase family protein [Cucumis melo var. makuwa]|uniref:MAP kinase kinase family protein n=1 Tax=Cucumis melo var. makuwa TaxID=1194695 RepID=A0A5D3BQT7_CUCMM|nr:MAP kinase kinase family protein [Cucumis melo var. makuwa]